MNAKEKLSESKPEKVNLSDIIFPAQCSCGHQYLERYTINDAKPGNPIAFCWCGFCRTRLNIFAGNIYEQTKSLKPEAKPVRVKPEKMMICPKAKGCPFKGCLHFIEHVCYKACSDPHTECPTCVEVKPEPKPVRVKAWVRRDNYSVQHLIIQRDENAVFFNDAWFSKSDVVDLGYQHTDTPDDESSWQKIGGKE